MDEGENEHFYYNHEVVKADSEMFFCIPLPLVLRLYRAKSDESSDQNRLPESHEHDELDSDELGKWLERTELHAHYIVEEDETVHRPDLRNIVDKDQIRVCIAPVEETTPVATEQMCDEGQHGCYSPGTTVLEHPSFAESNEYIST